MRGLDLLLVPKEGYLVLTTLSRCGKSNREVRPKGWEQSVTTAGRAVEGLERSYTRGETHNAAAALENSLAIPQN